MKTGKLLLPVLFAVALLFGTGCTKEKDISLEGKVKITVEYVEFTSFDIYSVENENISLFSSRDRIVEFPLNVGNYKISLEGGSPRSKGFQVRQNQTTSILRDRDGSITVTYQ